MIVPTSAEEDVGAKIIDTLSRKTGGTLKLNESKTTVSRFSESNRLLTTDRPLSYLGFDFDGTRKHIRPRTFARYQRRMIQAVRSASRAANKAAASGKDGKIWRRELYERYTHLGRRNFITYAYRCAEIMNAPEIKRQTKNHWKQINALIEES